MSILETIPQEEEGAGPGDTDLGKWKEDGSGAHCLGSQENLMPVIEGGVLEASPGE